MGRRYGLRVKFFQKQEGRCYYCKKPMAMPPNGKHTTSAEGLQPNSATWDHKIARSVHPNPKQANGHKNIVLACLRCNLKKKLMPAEEFLRYLKKHPEEFA